MADNQSRGGKKVGQNQEGQSTQHQGTGAPPHGSEPL